MLTDKEYTKAEQIMEGKPGDMCGEHYSFSEVFGMKPSKHICKECLPDEVVETLE